MTGLYCLICKLSWRGSYFLSEVLVELIPQQSNTIYILSLPQTAQHIHFAANSWWWNVASRKSGYNSAASSKNEKKEKNPTNMTLYRHGFLVAAPHLYN